MTNNNFVKYSMIYLRIPLSLAHLNPFPKYLVPVTLRLSSECKATGRGGGSFRNMHLLLTEACISVLGRGLSRAFKVKRQLALNWIVKRTCQRKGILHNNQQWSTLLNREAADRRHAGRHNGGDRWRKQGQQSHREKMNFNHKTCFTLLSWPAWESIFERETDRPPVAQFSVFRPIGDWFARLNNLCGLNTRF